MRLLLIDGSNVVSRCASVKKDATSAQVIELAANMVRRAVQTIRATHLVVVFDPAGETIRHREYPAYKATRSGGDDRHAICQAACYAFESSGVYCVMHQGVEADDVIATLAIRASTKNGLVTAHILSGDSDLLALARDGVHCWQFGRKDAGEDPIVERTPAWICKKYGIDRVEQLADYKALVGETGDNVPGVPKIGHKKAGQLLTEYGSIDEIARYGMLGNYSVQAVKMRALAALRTDIPLPVFNLKHCRIARRSVPA